MVKFLPEQPGVIFLNLLSLDIFGVVKRKICPPMLFFLFLFAQKSLTLFSSKLID